MHGNLNDIKKELNTDFEKGLTTAQVAEAQKKYGLNKFEEEKKDSTLKKIFIHLREVTAIILMIAAGISLYLSFVDDKSPFAAVIIMALVVLGIFLAIKQERSAEKTLDALKKMTAPRATVIRDGETSQIDAEELVPGDIILLEAGNMIPADARLIECSNLRVEEAPLTGESVPIEKCSKAEVNIGVAIGDRLNMLFSSCLITNGRAKAVVTETGMNTEMGKIAGLLNKTKKERTPLQQRLDKLGKMLSIVAILSAAILFVTQLIQGEPLMQILMSAVSLAVAVVPEALPIIVTMTLIYGVSNMAQKQAIVRKIPAVETLGSASVICSDKTGTLSQNKMTVVKLWEPVAGTIDIQNISDSANEKHIWVAKLFGLNCNAIVKEDNTEIGDPTELALVGLRRAFNLRYNDLSKQYPRVFEIPFDSTRKMMTTVHELEDGRFLSITKGAFDRLPAVIPAGAQEIHDEFGAAALRVLSVGYKFYDELPAELTVCELETDLTFAGLIGMIDPPRPESAEAVRIATQAGIRTVMITGDHKETAVAIAKEIGIFRQGDLAMTGVELEQLTDDQLFEKVQDYSVYARVSPECKIRIVQAWQRHGKIIAMTGDGTNDAPSLKAANIGVAMGSGTDVSKNASDMILTDDNFSSIISAVAEGRRVYHNVKKLLMSLIVANFSEIAGMLFAVIMGWGLLVTPLMLLYINLWADGLPDLFMSREPMEKDVMSRPPVNAKASIFDGIKGRIGVMSVYFAVAALTGFYLGQFTNISDSILPGHEVGMTMAFLIISIGSVLNILCSRSFRQPIWKIGLFSNTHMFIAALVSVGTTILLAVLPFMHSIFGTTHLALEHWLVVACFVILTVPVAEFYKFLARKKNWGM